ncbi:MAG: GIY-YIG nuclease family protein [Pyrinomonadaceae bacterium]
MEKKAAKLNYKLSHRPMGVFQIRNRANGRVLVDSSMDVPGKINRHRFQLNAGMHRCRPLQIDWNEFGESGFDFEELEPLEPRDDPNYDYRADLEFLEDLWLEKLEPYDEKGYNIRKLSRDERLRMIASRRNA